MDLEEGKAFLKACGCVVPQHQPRAGWAISDCALGPWNHTDGKSSPHVFGIRLDDGHCHCFSCDWNGSAEELVYELSLRVKKPLFGNTKHPNNAIDFKAALALSTSFDSPKKIAPPWKLIDEMLADNKTELHIYPEEWLQSFPPWSSVEWATAYLYKRHTVTAEIADYLDIRVDTKQQRVCVPVRDFHGRLVGLHSRAVSDTVEPRYKAYKHSGRMNPVVWLGEHWLNPKLPVVVVEGPFDLASVLRVYTNVMSPLYASPSRDKIMRVASKLGKKSTIITFLDNGTGGDKGREKFTNAIGKTHNVVHVTPPTGSKDPGGLEQSSIYEILTKVLPEHVLSVDPKPLALVS